MRSIEQTVNEDLGKKVTETHAVVVQGKSIGEVQRCQAQRELLVEKIKKAVLPNEITAIPARKM